MPLDIEWMNVWIKSNTRQGSKGMPWGRAGKWWMGNITYFMSSSLFGKNQLVNTPVVKLALFSSVSLKLCICFCLPVLMPSLFAGFFSHLNVCCQNCSTGFETCCKPVMFLLVLNWWNIVFSFDPFFRRKKSENWFREQEHKETKNIKNKTGQDPLYDWHMVVHFGLKRMINCYIYHTNFISSFHQPFLLCKKGKFLFSNWLNSLGHLNS